ncbi:MAG: hypothetical protein QM776_07985 [Rhodocyclaceae bacterium]
MPHPAMFVFLPLAGVVAFYLWRREARRTRRKFIDDFQFPAALPRKLRATYPHLSTAQAERTLDALRDYFTIVLWAPGRMVSMPSQAVNVVWHELILDTRAYQRFCQRAFGRFLHHTPAEAMSAPTVAQQGIKRAWALSCKLENINARQPNRLPLLFGLDALLAIPDGFRYSLDCRGKGAAAGDAAAGYCASDIGCSSGCGGSGCAGDSSSGGGDGGGDGGCGGGCGGGGD